jgi:hypothetical protein
MEFKGTKGKWKVNKCDEFSNAYYLYPTHPFIEQDANAKLIEAAPDLLYTLQGVLNLKPLLMYPYPPGTKSQHFEEGQAVALMFAKIERAIDKAITTNK